LFWISAFFITWVTADAYAQGRAKLIHYGWDNPSLSTLLEALKKLAASPFDGFSVEVPGLDQVFMTTINPAPILPETPDGTLAESYVVVHAATDDHFDWANDVHWQTALANMRTLAKLAHDGGFKGLVFDMEPYGKSPWDYQTQPAHTRLDFTAFQTLVEARGAAMMDAMQQEFPGLDIWCLYGLTAINMDDDTPLAEQGYGLWPAFFGGWIKASAPTTRVIDGNEPSYYYSDAKEFDANKARITHDLEQLLPEDARAAYAEKIHVAHSVYVDSAMNLAGSPRFIGYYFKSDAERLILLKQNIAAAVQSSDTLVWVYAENIKWWEAPPRSDIDEAIRAAKIAPTSQPSPIIRAAAENWKARISIGGKFTDKYGKPAKPDSFRPALANVACSTWGDRGEYGCDFPKGSTIVVEPVFKARSAIPARIKLRNLQKSTWGVNWRVE
jgi:hypothetical protein